MLNYQTSICKRTFSKLLWNKNEILNTDNAKNNNNNNNNNKSVNQHKYTRKDKAKHVSDRDDIEVCAGP